MIMHIGIFLDLSCAAHAANMVPKKNAMIASLMLIIRCFIVFIFLSPFKSKHTFHTIFMFMLFLPLFHILLFAM